MESRTVVLMPGDGIGRVVLREAVRVLEAVGFRADYVSADIGWDCFANGGAALPDRTIELLRTHRLGLMGAITSRSRAEILDDPRLASRADEYFSPILALRQIFDLDVCWRPCVSLPGNPLNFVRRAADGSIEEPRVHVDVIRQNTEGLYAGVEWTRVPREVRDALTTHPRFAPFVDVQDDDLAATVRLVTRSATRRVLRFAFERAVQRGATTVTLCDKPNVLRATGGLFEEEARRAASEFPDVRLRTVNIDAQMMWLTRSPEDEEVVVAGNMFGDIVSDAFAGLVGGLGFACSANLGRDVALFEPTHGSAPRYAALDPPIVNPSAAILAGAMLLDHVGESAKASQVRSAVRRVVAEGRVRTYDMCRLQGGPQVLGQGAVSTGRFADAVIEALQHS